MEGKRVTNWAETFACSPELFFQPESLDEIKQILNSARQKVKKVRCIAEGHSPSDIAMTTEYLISMKKFNKVIQIDTDKCQVKVEPGCTLADLTTNILPKHDMTLGNLPAILDVSIGGVICTGTHGTGIKHGILATQIVDIDLLTAQGQLMHCCRDDEDTDLFRAATCSLGVLGIIVAVTIQCVPMFKLSVERRSCMLDETLTHLDDDVANNDYYRFMWFPHTENVVQSKSNRTTEPVGTSTNRFTLESFIIYYMLQPMYWLCAFFPRFTASVNQFLHDWCFTAPRLTVGPSYSALTYDCLFKQLVTDWAVPWSETSTVLRKLRSWLEANKDVHVHVPVEVRFAKGDDIMLSPANGHDSCFINIIMYRPFGRSVPCERYWAAFQEIMLESGGRPHWAKAHNLTSKELREMYPEFEKFGSIRKSLDPQGMFINKCLENIFS